jgi:predicted  nucleic acid-binding Zn ribbon protein
VTPWRKLVLGKTRQGLNPSCPPFEVFMKKRRPSHENPFLTKNTKYEKQCNQLMGDNLPKSKKRQCKMVKSGKKCKNAVPEKRYFYCKDCQPLLPVENGFDTF